MKIIIKFIITPVISILLLAGTLISCQKADSPPDAAPSVQITESFVITRPSKATDSENVAAKSIYNACKEIGIQVYIGDDWYKSEADIPQNEILIGQTNRAESQSALSGLAERDYTVTLKETDGNGYKIVLAATGEAGIEAAAEYFIQTYLTGDSAGKLPLDLQYTYTYIYPCENITVGNTPIGDYKIVYAQEGVTSPVDPNYQTFIQTAKYKDTAEALADLIEAAAHVRPEVIPDTETVDDGTPVILFGKTKLKADDFAYQTAFTKTGSYIGRLLDNDAVVLAGDNACAVYAAGEAFVNALCQAKTALTSFDVTGEKDLIKVACIGDSITHGTTSSDESAYNYPVYLQRMLGYDYYVEKYGAPGFSMTSTDQFAYMNYSIYNSSLNAKPDVVIIMLGTNDCNPNDAYKNWNDSARSVAFKRSANTMISAYKRANRNVQIYLMTPPTVPQNQAWADNVKNYAVPLITEIAEAQNCLLIDIYSWSLKHTSTFTADGGDGLHPKNEHYSELAEAVYEGLKDTILKK